MPSESIDLIYIDPPFFSGRQYNVIFGDQNELRSFSDIWEGGIPGYLIWLNVRLYEMKRLLKKTGSIYVHCDHHASHYIKVEMDKIFGFQNFRNEIVWWYHMGAKSRKEFSRKHDVLLRYSRGPNPKFYIDRVRVPFKESSADNNFYFTDEQGRRYREKPSRSGKLYRYYLDEGSLPEDVWDIPTIPAISAERIGYPTQKPVELLQRLIDASSDPGDVVADFFVGGGSFLIAAMGLRVERLEEKSHTQSVKPDAGRRWIGCDQSRVAVAITQDRLTRLVDESISRCNRTKLEVVGPAAQFLIQPLYHLSGVQPSHISACLDTHSFSHALDCPSSQSCPAVKSTTSQGSRQSRSAITWLPCLTCFGSGSEPCFAGCGRAAV